LGVVEGAGGCAETKARWRDCAGSFPVDIDVEQAFLGGAGKIGAAAGAGGQAPSGVFGAPGGGDLEPVADGAAGLNAGVEILLKALGDALLVGPDVDGSRTTPARGSMKKPPGVSSGSIRR